MNNLWKKQICDEYKIYSSPFFKVNIFLDIFKMNISLLDKDDKDYTSNNEQLKCNCMNFSDNSSSSILYSIEDEIIE